MRRFGNRCEVHEHPGRLLAVSTRMATHLLHRTLLATLCSLGAGCTTSYSIRPDKLVALDGFNAATPSGAVRTVEAEDGQKVEYRAGRELKLTPKAWNAEDVGGEFSRIEARPGLLVGSFVRGNAMTFDLTQFKSAEITEFSAWKTAVALGLTIPLVVGAIVFVVLLSGFHWSGQGPLGP